MLRGSIVCDSVLAMRVTLDVLCQVVNEGGGRIVCVKNRCLEPNMTGLRDLLVNFRIPVPSASEELKKDDKEKEEKKSAGKDVFYHVCEVQIHHSRMKEHDEQTESHKIYEYFRSFLVGEKATVEAKIKGLMMLGREIEEAGSFQVHQNPALFFLNWKSCTFYSTFQNGSFFNPSVTNLKK